MAMGALPLVTTHLKTFPSLSRRRDRPRPIGALSRSKALHLRNGETSKPPGQRQKEITLNPHATYQRENLVFDN